MIIDAIHICSTPESGTAGQTFAQLSLNQASLTDGYILQSALGLDVEEVFPQIYGSYYTDIFHNQAMPPREITLKIRLNPKYDAGETPADLRNNLYKVIAYSRTAGTTLNFMLGTTVVATIDGNVKKLEADIFSSEPSVQMVVRCPYPWFRGPSDISLQGQSGVTVPSPILNDPYSNAPHGFKMRLQFTGTVSTSFTIQGKYGTTQWPFKILRASGSPFVSGDSLYFSSEQDDKYLYIVHNGITTYLADSIDFNQVWPIMFPGQTRLGFSSSSVSIVELTYKPHYWGV
jgi:hypothetical protein